MRYSLKIRASLFNKLILSLLIIIGVFYAFSMYFIYLAESDTKNQVLNLCSASLGNYLSSIENDFQRIHNTQELYVNDYELRILSIGGNLLTPYDQLQSIKALQLRLNLLSSTSKYIEQVFVQIPSIQKTVTSDFQVDNMDADDYSKFSSFISYSGNLFLFSNNKLYMNLPYPEIIARNTKPIYNIVANISLPSFKKDLSGIFDENGESCLLISNDKDWEVTTNPVISDGLKQTNVLTKQKPFKQQFVKINNENYWVVCKSSDFLNVSLYVCIPQKIIYKNLQKYKYRYVLLTLLTVILLAIFTYWTNYIFGLPMKKLMYSFKKIESGELNYTINHQSNDEFSYIYKQFNDMIHKIQQLITEVYEQKIMTQQAELRQLQYQINPHFLYNSIYLIYRMSKMQDYDKITLLAKSLGGYYKYITRTTLSDVEFQDEVKHAKDYIEIQSIRFSDHILVMFDDIPEACEEIKFPPLTLQPIIENAYNHSLEKASENSILKISIRKSESCLSIIIEDNGTEMNVNEIEQLSNMLNYSDLSKKNSGLVNVHRRLIIKYGPGSGLLLSKSTLGGLSVEVRIPINSGGNNNVQSVNC